MNSSRSKTKKRAPGGIDLLNSVAVDAGYDCGYVQLEPGTLQASSNTVQIGRLNIVHEVVDLSIEYRGVVHSDALTMILLRSGPNAKISGIDFAEGDLWIIPNGFDLSMVTGGYIDVYTLSVPRHLLEIEIPENSSARISLELDAPFSLRLTDDDLNELFTTIHACLKAHANFEVAYELESMVTMCISNAFKKLRVRQGIDRDRRFKRHLRLMQASDYIANNLHRTVPVSELSEMTAISERTMLRYFHAHFGMSPYQYARVKRLEEVRRILANQTARRGLVSDTAFAFGFEHMWRFASDFKNHFGVLPKDVPTQNC